MNLIANQKKYGQIKAANFIIDQGNHFCRLIIKKCIQRILNIAYRILINYTTVHKYNNTCHKTIKMKPVDVSPIM